MKVQVDPGYQGQQFHRRTSSCFFVDKTLVLSEIFQGISSDERCVCITRPRRFGKSMVASMIASFFGPKDAAALFDKLAIAKHPDYAKFLNSYHVIYLDLITERKNVPVEVFLDDLEAQLRHKLAEVFPDVIVSEQASASRHLAEIYEKTGAQFIFVIDEWDSILHKGNITAVDRANYLHFFTALLKEQSYVAYAYLTGILPIAKYSPGSDLNMFADYTFINDKKFDAYFGFTQAEVDQLFTTYTNTCPKPEISRAELDLWYNGYTSASAIKLYNPQSIITALRRNELDEYWGESGPNEELFELIRFNAAAVLPDIETLLLDKEITAEIRARYATAPSLNTRERILSALVVYGLLTQTAGITHDRRILRIPNEEIRRKIVRSIRTNDNFKELHTLGKQSQQFEDALYTLDAAKIAAILQEIHTSTSPVKDYNRELELAHVLHLALIGLSESTYTKHRELQAGTGFADYILEPVGANTTLPTFIIELKVGASPKEAIAQIKSRNYAHRYQRKERLQGPIFAVGITYDAKDPSKTHHCEIAELARECC